MRFRVGFLLSGVPCLFLSPQLARAHIIMQGELIGRDGDQKAAPCEGMPRTETPYVFEPGATIELAAMEGIPHDGYFRISFDEDGTDFVDPKSIAPLNPDRYGPDKKCQGTSDDHCGKSDFCSDSTVLWDNLDPHLGTDVTLGQIRTWTIQLPKVECDNCTIQVMQVMEDPADGAHGPFDGKDDLYYRCVDVTLKKGAGVTPGTVTGPVKNVGMQCDKGDEHPDHDGRDDHDDVAASSANEDGCSVSPARSAPGTRAVGLFAALATVFVARRRKTSPSRRAR